MRPLELPMQTLDGRVALLTGASRGIGPLISDRLARAGLKLVLVARDRARLDAEVARLQATGATAVAVAGDVCDGAVQEAALAAAEALGGLSALINNAGVEDFGHLTDTAPETIADTIAVNLTAPLQLCRRALPALLARDEAQIVNVASVAGLLGTPYGATYSATKAGLIMASLSLRMELTETRVGVSAVCPAFVHGAGMHEEAKRLVGRAPALLGSTTAEATADAVLRALRDNPAELIVNDAPLRPLVGFGRSLPGFATWLTGRLAGPYMRKLADARRPPGA
jgi:short-subunit dehydrogenase